MTHHLLLPGMQIGDYSIIQKIGNGGFGTVYKVESNTNSKQYAMKILKNTCTTSINKEIEIATMLGNKSDQNPARRTNNCFAYVHDIGKSDNFSYYVSELLGPSLDTMISKQEENDLTDQSTDLRKRALRFSKEMILCLKKIHAMHIIHCDIKPANFLIRNDMNEISLIDFGLSKISSNTFVDHKMNIQNLRDFFEKVSQFNISITNKNSLIQKVDLSNKIIRNKAEQFSNKIKVKTSIGDLNQFKKRLCSLFNNNFGHKSKVNKYPKKSKQHFKGTYKYASSNALNGGILGPRDDLISWFYSILEIYSGSPILPWESLSQEIMANQNATFSYNLSTSSNSDVNSLICESPLIEMKKMKEYFECNQNDYVNQDFILPEQLCQNIKMPLEMAAAFRCILAQKPGELFYSDSLYDEIISYIDSSIHSLENY